MTSNYKFKWSNEEGTRLHHPVRHVYEGGDTFVDNNRAIINENDVLEVTISTQPSKGSERNDVSIYSLTLGIAEATSKILITHPCSVIRRQCQLHQYAKSLHLQPFTLIPVVCRAVSNDGIFSLWKGWMGITALLGVSTVTEMIISDVFGLPRHIVPNGSRRKYFNHIYLKAATCFLMMPFHISAFIDTVKSQAGLTPNDYRITDVFTNAIERLKYDLFGPRDNSKRFSILFLSIPGALFYTTHYIVSQKIYEIIHETAKKYVMRKKVSDRTIFHQFMPQVVASMMSVLVADAILYPFETVLHRLYIQGTRTLIDNMDTGLTAISITAKYTGFFQCFEQILKKEGRWALYSGIGALMIQGGLQLSLLKCIRFGFEYTNNLFNKENKNQLRPVQVNEVNNSAPSYQYEMVGNGSSIHSSPAHNQRGIYSPPGDSIKASMPSTPIKDYSPRHQAGTDEYLPSTIVNNDLLNR
uniref:Solute carrier family 25 member 46 n=1 Tax=Rhabditophanes sp. KR3021 TaxID=114890 RepID=A0AC35TGS3_9BILA